MTEGTTASAPGVYTAAASLGLIAGLRAAMPFALLSVVGNRSDSTLATADPSALRLFRSRGALIAFGAAEAGELVGDKLPMTPSRLDAGPLGGRLVSGAIVGALLCRGGGRAAWSGALLGAVSAALGAFVGYTVRAQLARATKVPSPLLGAAEDALAIGLGLRTLQRYLRD